MSGTDDAPGSASGSAAGAAPPRVGRRRPARLADAAFAPRAAAVLAWWRVVVGGGLAYWGSKLLRDRGDGLTWVEAYYVEPVLHFKYPLFGWVHPPPEPWMTLLVGGIVVAGLLLAAGLFTRAAALAAALGFTWVFLIERVAYQNHYYLLAMVAWGAVALPLDRGWSLDNLRERRLPAAVPAWAVWLVRLQVGLPYVFGGIAKLHPDWLSGEPMAGMLRSKSWIPPLAPLLPGGSFESWFPQTVAFFTWGGLLLDLLVVPALLYRRTRPAAYAMAVAFHLSNALMFRIGVFPWFMIAATLVFFPADTLRPAFRLVFGRLAPGACRVYRRPRRAARAAVLTGLAAYTLVMVTLPLRHRLHGGEVNWTESGHLFSWHMMLRGKDTAPRYTAELPDGTAAPVDLRGYLTPGQMRRFGRDPELLRQLATAIREGGVTVVAVPTGRLNRVGLPGTRPVAVRPRPGNAPVTPTAVRALVLTSLNGRKPQLFVDPTVDLSRAETPWLGPADWIMPLYERPRLPDGEPWREDVRLWERLVELDPAAARRLAAARAAE